MSALRCAGCGDPCTYGNACRKCLWWDAFRTAVELGALGADHGRIARVRRPKRSGLWPITQRVAALEMAIARLQADEHAAYDWAMR